LSHAAGIPTRPREATPAGADRRVAEQVGFDHYLVKPANPALLVGILDSLHGGKGG